MLDWLLTPLSGAHVHHLPSWTIWHARLMVLAWGMLLPLGALIARFGKVWPGQDWPRQLDSKKWWHSHLALQGCGIVSMSAGAWLAWGQARHASLMAIGHSYLGWTVLSIGWLQVVGGMLRGSKGGPTDTTLRGDHYDMTLYRVIFERVHKGLGWLAIAGAIPCIVAGLMVADAPRWMLIVLGSWWLLLSAGFAVLQRQGACLDTYQAIWGHHPDLPGLCRPPIGLGVRRHPPEAKPPEDTRAGTAHDAAA